MRFRASGHITTTDLLSAMMAALRVAGLMLLLSAPCTAGIMPDEEFVVLSTEEADTVLEIVRSQWIAAREQIQSAALTYHTSSGPFLKPLNPWTEAIGLLDEHDIVNNPRNMAELTAWLNREGTKYREERFHPCSLHVEGKRLKTDHFTGFLQAVDEDHHYLYSRVNREIHLFRRGQSSIGFDHPQLMRQIPDPRRLEHVQEVWRYPQAGLLRLNDPVVEGAERSFTMIHEASGLPHLIRVCTQEGRPLRDHVLLNYVTYPGDVEFPSISMSFTYRNDLIDGYNLFLIDTAEFNVPVQDSDLAFGVPAGVFIRDERVPDTIQTVSFTEPVDDVARYVEEVMDLGLLAGTEDVVQGTAPEPVSDMILWINGAALVAVGACLWRWRPAREQSPGGGKSPPAAK